MSALEDIQLHYSLIARPNRNFHTESRDIHSRCQKETTPRHEEATISSSPPSGLTTSDYCAEVCIGRSSSDFNVDIITTALAISTTS